MIQHHQVIIVNLKVEIILKRKKWYLLRKNNHTHQIHAKQVRKH